MDSPDRDCMETQIRTKQQTIVLTILMIYHCCEFKCIYYLFYALLCIYGVEQKFRFWQQKCVVIGLFRLTYNKIPRHALNLFVPPNQYFTIS